MGAVRADYCLPHHAESQSLRLVQVHVFFRHGDRSPAPALGNADCEVWNSRLEQVPEPMTPRQYQYQERPFGHLTTKGAEQARELGVWIREAYLKNLSVVDNPESFLRVRSTNFLRTHMTAWFVLEGLLDSTELPASVPIIILDDRLENLYHNDHCPRLAKLWRAAWNKIRKEQLHCEDGGHWSARFEDVRRSLVAHLELPESPRFPWVLAADSAHCALCHGDPLPENVTEKKVAEIRSHLAQDYAKSFQDTEICELSMGRLMREVVDAMLQHRLSSGPLMYLYSGHDATIVPLSVALGNPWKDWPEYAASISIELWSSREKDDLDAKEQLFVRVLYDGFEVALPASSYGIEVVWQSPSAAASSKTLHTLEEFLRVAEWTMLSEAQFQNRCQCDFGLEVLSLC